MKNDEPWGTAILQNTLIMNLAPLGRTYCSSAVLEVDADILTLSENQNGSISVLYVIFFVARRMGKQERARLGITELTADEIEEMTTVTDPETPLQIRRPKTFQWYLDDWIDCMARS